MQKLQYDRSAAVAYAREWALGRNPAYYDFEHVGGDCTNFVSQCIHAGARVMNYTKIMGWYYRSSADRTAAWTGVPFLYKFLTGNASVGPYAHEVARNAIAPGDIVQLGDTNGDFYHTCLITAVTPDILIATHSYDAWNRPLTSYDAAIFRFLHIDGVRTW